MEEKIRPLLKMGTPSTIGSSDITDLNKSQVDIMNRLDNAIQKIEDLDVINLNNTLGKVNGMLGNDKKSLLGSGDILTQVTNWAKDNIILLVLGAVAIWWFVFRKK
jgi:hypothetical protein